MTFTASANLPIGAGLGSSAAFSTCVASSLLIAHGIISKPTDERFSSGDTDIIDGYAFLAEKVLHGNPSGIDNAVSVRGGAVAFTRSIGGRQGGLQGMNGYVTLSSSLRPPRGHADYGRRFSSIRLLLTNTLVPRDTKSLVAGVSAKRLAEPHVVDPILEAIQEISDEAKHLLGGAEIDRKQLISRLEVSLHLVRVLIFL